MRRYIQEYRSMDDLKTAVSLKVHPGTVTASESWSLECTTQPAGSLTDWRVSLPACPVGLSLF